jgi:hypothetical protein
MTTMNAVGTLALCMLSTCGIADHYEAQSRMNTSQDAYRKCVADHVGQPSTCDAQKAFYEQDKAAFEK